jgi:peptidoglycan/xylan/chitin deacetylase (PgdA/CDA1 family)
MAANRIFDHSAEGGEGPSISHQRRRQAIAAIAFVSLVLGAAVGSGGGGHDSPGTASATAKPPATPRRQHGWVAHTGPVPILMYHGVDAAVDPPIGGNLQISPAAFRSQLRWLRAKGYAAVTMHEVERAWAGLGKLPRKPIVLSFDDGFHSQARIAFPEMRKLGWPGVLNLAVNNLTWDRGITFDEAQTVLDGGWELASHTINHIDLTRASNEALTHELVDTKRILESTFQREVSAFCYPGGTNDARVQAAVRKAGYHSATTVIPKIADSSNMLALSRIHVTSDLDGPALGALIKRAESGDAAGPNGYVPAA